MGTIEEVWDSLKFQTYQRLSNPLTGAYVLSWLAFNFDLLLALFGTGEFEKKIAYIDQHVFVGIASYVWRYGGPFVAAATYVWGYPLIAREAIKYTTEESKETANIVAKIDGGRLWTAEGVAVLQGKLKSQEDKFHADLLGLIESNDKLLSRLLKNLAPPTNLAS